MTYIAAGPALTSGHLIGAQSLNRRKHINIARELSRDLRLAAREYERTETSALDPSSLWQVMQPHPELKEQFKTFLDDLYFDGIRSRFFGDFDADKLILPVAGTVAERLEALAADLEKQLNDLTG